MHDVSALCVHNDACINAMLASWVEKPPLCDNGILYTLILLVVTVNKCVCISTLSLQCPTVMSLNDI